MKTIFIAILCVFMTACVYSQNTYQNNTNHIDEQKMVQIEVGKTNKQWIISNMGMPDKIQSDNNGNETYEYMNTTKVKSDKKFIFLFSINSEKVTGTRTLEIGFKNNIVDSIHSHDKTH